MRRQVRMSKHLPQARHHTGPAGRLEAVGF